jgi:transcriptional regulator with PAS, ATPase and Fis domain
MLVEYFVKRYAEKTRKPITKIDKNTLKLCQSYRWPGNIRELQNIIERSVMLCTGDTFWIDEAWLSTQDAPRLVSSGLLTQNVQNYEKELIEAALEESKGKVAKPNGAVKALREGSRSEPELQKRVRSNATARHIDGKDRKQQPETERSCSRYADENDHDHVQKF